ncbi:type II toxin-antitoxin system VapB family antitoxin [Glycomyces tarimensis]
MSRTVINLDDDLVTQAAEILGTTTKVSTVNTALKEIVSAHRRREFLDWLAGGGLPDLGDEQLTEQAWR